MFMSFNNFVPPAARERFLKKLPPGPPQKLLISKKFLEVSEPFYQKGSDPPEA
jgi:hypothetical protein